MPIQLSQESLKQQARKLVQQSKFERYTTLKLSAALEMMAKHHGFANWNTAKAKLPVGSPPVPQPDTPIVALMRGLFRSRRVRHHTMIPPSQANGAVLAARGDYLGSILSYSSPLTEAFNSYRSETRRSLPSGADDWANAVMAAAYPFTRNGNPERRIVQELEFVAECTMLRKLEGVTDLISRYATAELVAEHFEPLYAFFERFREGVGTEYVLDFYNALQPFAHWFCIHYGIANHEGRSETWADFGDPYPA